MGQLPHESTGLHQGQCQGLTAVESQGIHGHGHPRLAISNSHGHLQQVAAVDGPQLLPCCPAMLLSLSTLKCRGASCSECLAPGTSEKSQNCANKGHNKEEENDEDEDKKIRKCQLMKSEELKKCAETLPIREWNEKMLRK